MNAKHSFRETQEIAGKAAWTKWLGGSSEVQWEDLADYVRQQWIDIGMAAVEAWTWSFGSTNDREL